MDARGNVLAIHDEKSGTRDPAKAPAARKSGAVKSGPSEGGLSTRDPTQVLSKAERRSRCFWIELDALEMAQVGGGEHSAKR